MGLASRLAKNLQDSLFFGPSFPFRHIAALAGCNKFTVTLRDFGPILLRNRRSDAEAFRHIFLRREYDFSRNSAVKAAVDGAYRRLLASGKLPVIIDAGASIGASTIWFATQYPDARVIAIEPDPEDAVLCRMNTCTLGGVRILEAAGGAVARTIPDLLREQGDSAALWMVKIDMEEFEEDLFASDTEWIKDASVVIIEPHDRLSPDRSTDRRFQKTLAEYDFDLLISGEVLVYFK
jgi:hypothetical protein